MRFEDIIVSNVSFVTPYLKTLFFFILWYIFESFIAAPSGGFIAPHGSEIVGRNKDVRELN